MYNDLVMLYVQLAKWIIRDGWLDRKIDKSVGMLV